MTRKTLQVDNEKLKNVLHKYTEKATLNWGAIVANTARAQQPAYDSDAKRAEALKALDEAESHVHIFKDSPIWNTIRAALSQPQPMAVPEGYVLLPIDPDDDYVEQVAFKAGVCGGIFESVHSAMISAAPQPPTSSEGADNG